MIEIILDASQLEVFEACPRKWHYSYVKNLIPLQSHRSFDIGSYYHEVLALFYSLPLGPTPYPNITESSELWKQYLLKTGRITAYNDRIKYACEFSSNPNLLQKFNIKDIDAQAFHRKRIVDYIYRYSEEDEYLESIAIEQGFSRLLYEDASRRYILEGKIDFVGSGKPYGFFVMDHKTQSRYDDRWEFNHQVCNYLSVTKADYFVYNYIGLQDKLPMNGMRRMIYKPHPGMLEQWEKEVLRTFHEMYDFITKYQETDRILHAEQFPRRRAACDSSKYGLCAYHKLCSVPDGSKWVGAVESAYKEKDQRWRAWT